jgi:hypothetical protein
MAQNSQSATATRNTVPGTANANPISPELFTGSTGVARRDYIPDAKRVSGTLETPECAQARAFFAEGEYARCRTEARRVVADKASPAEAKMEAGDLLDKTALDHGPIATAVAFLILLALILMFISQNGSDAAH